MADSTAQKDAKEALLARRRPRPPRSRRATPWSATCPATCAPTTGTWPWTTWTRPGPSGWPRSRPSRPASPRTGRRGGPWSGSAGARPRPAPRPGTSSTSSPTTCRSWSTRCGWSCAGTGPPRSWSCTRSCGSAGMSPGRCARCSGWSTGTGQAHDEIAESWTHIEIARLPDGEDAVLQRDLQRVLGDVRVAVEDWPRMQAKAVQLAEQLAMVAGRRRLGRRLARRGRGAAALAGRRSLHLPRLPRVRPGGRAGRDGAARRARHRAGHPAARPGGLERVRGAAARGAGPGPGPAAADPDQGELPLDRAPAELPRLRRGQAAGRAGEVVGRVPVPRPVHPRRLHREHHPDPGAAAQAHRRARGDRHRRRQPRRQGPGRVPGELPARGAVPDPGGRS